MSASVIDSCTASYNFTPQCESDKVMVVSTPSRKVVATSLIKKHDIVITEEYLINVNTVKSDIALYTLIALMRDKDATRKVVDLCEHHGIYPRTIHEAKACALLGYSADIVETRWEEFTSDECKCLFYLRMNEHVVNDKSYIYVTASAINSSCSPNCIFCIDIDGTIHIQANTDIQIGDELTTAYYPSLITETCKEKRQAITLTNHGFICECSYCVSDSKALRCHRCGRSDVNILECSRCKKVYYCSQECQRDHWTMHKTDCKH